MRRSLANTEVHSWKGRLEVPARLRLPSGLVLGRDRRALANADPGVGEQLLQAHDFRLRRKRILRLLFGLAQTAAAGLEARLPRTGIATGGHLRPAQFFAARLRRIGPRPFLLVKGSIIVRCIRRWRLRGRPNAATLS